MCVHPPPRLLITSGVMWCDMDSISLVKQVLQLSYGSCSMLSVMGMALELKRIVETYLIRVSYCCVSYYLHFNTPFKQLYTSNKMECFSYKGGCGWHGCSHIEVFKRRAGLGYR